MHVIALLAVQTAHAAANDDMDRLFILHVQAMASTQ
jgi:hypothetical protein